MPQFAQPLAGTYTHCGTAICPYADWKLYTQVAQQALLTEG